MALSISNHSLLPLRLSASTPLKSSQTLTLTLHLPPLSRRLQPFSVSASSPIFGNFIPTKRPFQSSHAVQDSAPSTSNEVEVPQAESEADLNHVSNLKTLIGLYKQAILDGDEKTMSEIEVRMHSIDKEKNELVQNVSALSEEIASGKARYIRLQADFDNFRKRSDKDRSKVRDNAKGEVMESLLPMVDSFERAKQQIKPETEMEQKIDTSYQGIYKQFVEIMRSLNVAAVPTVGKPFDPSVHEAIAREESEQVKEGIVIEEFSRGFRLGDRLLRPAKVKVSSGPGSKKVAKPNQPAAMRENLDQLSGNEPV